MLNWYIQFFCLWLSSLISSCGVFNSTLNGNFFLVFHGKFNNGIAFARLALLWFFWREWNARNWKTFIFLLLCYIFWPEFSLSSTLSMFLERPAVITIFFNCCVRFSIFGMVWKNLTILIVILSFHLFLKALCFAFSSRFVNFGSVFHLCLIG